LFWQKKSYNVPIETEFSASMAKLTPLKARIAATDRLIDRIVYRLYGLTEEEIALVEGNPDIPHSWRGNSLQ